MAITISYHQSVTKLQAFAFPVRSPFDRAEWFTLLERHGAKPLVAIAEDAAGALALPLAQGAQGLEALANWFTFSWRPLVTEGADVEALLQAVLRDLRRRSHRLVLAPLPEEDGTAAQLETALRAAGWLAELTLAHSNRFLPTRGQTFTEYWERRPGPFRTALKRKERKLEIEIQDFYEADAWATYQSVYAASWKPDEAQAALLEAFARDEGAAGRLRLGLARHEGTPVAAQFWTVDNGAAYIHKLAHCERAKSLSAGTVLTAAMMRHAMDSDKVALVDFGTGDDAYKRDWMDEQRLRYRLEALDPAQPRAWPKLAKRHIARLARAFSAR